MTALEHVTQIQQFVQNHGAQIALYWMDPETGERYEVRIQEVLAPAPDGVCLVLVPVRTAQPVAR